MGKRARRGLAVILGVLWLGSFAIARCKGPAGAAGCVPGELRSHATIQSIGIEWDIEGDANHNAVCPVQYRAQGSVAWKQALPLLRVDYFGWYADTKADRAYNMLAGSILFLAPGTTYEVKLDLSDADGGKATKTLSIRTRPIPSIPEGGRTFHVVPAAVSETGSAGGDGSKGRPLKGLKVAQAAAKPGDIVLLHGGKYGEFTFDKAGVPGRYLAWKAAGDGEAAFEHVEIPASHVWLEGLALARTGKSTSGLVGRDDATDVVVSRCRFTGFHYSILLSKGSRDWYIADNVITGDNDPASSNISGEGIELNHSSGHAVAYNSISRTADGVSYPHRNCDIYGNDIFDVSDDGLEPDYGYANNRMWQNRLTNCHNAALSFQPMYCGPWYFVRNQIVGAGEVFKFRVQDRFVLANNTFVSWGHTASYMHHVLTSLSRNNLYISAGVREGREPGPLWIAIYYKDSGKYVLPPSYAAGWMTDVDYDGFDWGEAKQPFAWEGGRQRFADLPSFAAAIGIEKHGVRVRKEEIFERYSVPGRRARVEPFDLALKAGSNAIDAGAPLANIVEDFAGKAPDLGAYEFGKPLPHYGPRDAKLRLRRYGLPK
jgi:hypothetical protein